MNLKAHLLVKAATPLKSFPTGHSSSIGRKLSNVLGREFYRSHYHQSCCAMTYPRTVATELYLTRGGSQGRRLLSSSSSKADKSKEVVSNAKINERGSIWIYIGWTILGLVGVDQALQYKQEQEDNERRQMLAQMQLDADNDSINVADWDETLPTLFTCKILHVDSGLDGTKMLTRSKKHRGGIRSGINGNIKRGDTVEILEADVGPGYVFQGDLYSFITKLFSYFLFTSPRQIVSIV